MDNRRLDWLGLHAGIRRDGSFAVVDGVAMTEALSEAEKASFKEYAESSLTESDGAKCQWADYTLRLLAENERLKEHNEILLRMNQEIASSNADHIKWHREAEAENERLKGELEKHS